MHPILLAALLCARLLNGQPWGVVRVRPDACRWNERVVGSIDGTPAAIQGPPGPQGIPGVDGADGKDALTPQDCVYWRVPTGRRIGDECHLLAPAYCDHGVNDFVNAEFPCDYVTVSDSFWALCCPLR